MGKTKEQQNTNLTWLQKHGIKLLLVAGIILVILCTSVQTVVVSGIDEDTGDKYNVTLKYSVCGLCVKALPDDNSQKINADYVLFLNTMDASVEKTADWLVNNKCDKVEIYTMGYLRDQDKLTAQLCDKLTAQGIVAQKGERQ